MVTYGIGRYSRVQYWYQIGKTGSLIANRSDLRPFMYFFVHEGLSENRKKPNVLILFDNRTSFFTSTNI